MANFIGIDLGTTFSVVAYIDQNGTPQAIPNENGKFVTPSVVYLGEDGPIVGDEAKERQSFGETEVASFFKRSMGDPNFELMFAGQTYSPTDLSALVLEHLKQTAERFLGHAISQAVITVPAYFNNMQRQATIEAGKRAGLEVLSIISEPTAAALAYGMSPGEGSQTVLVYDLGGGTFDVSIVEITPSEQRVLGTGGDHNLGGKDWDDRIFSYLVQKFADEFGQELVGDDFNELLVKAENAKKSLSARQVVDIRVQGAGQTATYQISRDLFESLTSDLMERTQRLTEQVLADVQRSWAGLSNVLLVGGSTRMPMVKDYVERMSGKAALTTVNPDEAVALGAAIQAALDMEALRAPEAPIYALAGRKKSIDVISHSLGMIAISEDNTRYVNSIIIPKNQAIPSRQTRPYTLRVGQHRQNKLEVYMTQGETDNPLDCAYLGKYLFANIPAAAGSKAILDITYAYDQNGVVNVSAVERTTQQPLSLTIEPLPGDIPQRFAQPPVQEARREFLTVYLVFDLSGSMGGQPLREAQKAAHAFGQQCDLANTSLGLISFSERVQLEITACQNAREIGRAIDNLEVGRTGYGTSANPFNEVGELLGSVSGRRYALVLTDGLWKKQERAIRTAQTCHAAGIEIVAIGFGKADKSFLRQISSSDEHSFFTSMQALTETFSAIAQELTERSGISRLGGLKTIV